MKGLVKYARGSGNMEIREVVERKELEPEEVRVEIRATGICGSDLHIFHDEIQIPMRPPVIIGHEFSGEVVEVGAAVVDLVQGDRVTGVPTVKRCGECRYCRTDFINLCPKRESLGYIHNGSFAPSTVLPARNALKLPETVDYRMGALTEPLACCVHAVTELTGISAGDLVAVVGPGAIGLLCQQVAQAEGGRTVVFGTKRDRHRLELASRLGAERVVNIDEEEAGESLVELSEGYGADVVLECSGHPGGAQLAIDLVRRQGKFTQVGLFGKPIEFDLEQIAYKEIRLTGSLGQKPSAWRRALTLLGAGRIETEPLISHQFALEDWSTAFSVFEKGEGVKLFLDVAR